MRFKNGVFWLGNLIGKFGEILDCGNLSAFAARRPINSSHIAGHSILETAPASLRRKAVPHKKSKAPQLDALRKFEL